MTDTGLVRWIRDHVLDVMPAADCYRHSLWVRRVDGGWWVLFWYWDWPSIVRVG